MITPEQTARVNELDRLLASPNYIHDILRSRWEAERYRLLANASGQSGNYVTYASARDAQKAEGLQNAIAGIDRQLAALDGQPEIKGRANILRGDRQRFTDELAALTDQPQRVDVESVARDMQSGGLAPEGFDFAVPAKYSNQGEKIPAAPVEKVDPFDAGDISKPFFAPDTIAQDLGIAGTVEPALGIDNGSYDVGGDKGIGSSNDDGESKPSSPELIEQEAALETSPGGPIITPAEDAPAAPADTDDIPF